jgi:hypothetical protein
VFPARFERFISRGVECWTWIGCLVRGYGQFRHEGKPIGAHRAAWVFANGQIPPGLWVLHKCDNARCVRPDHLFLGTRRMNVQDMLSKNRQASGERVNHAKVTSEVVVSMRRTYASGGIKFSDLAARFGISTSAAFEIVTGQTWKHVGQEQR